MTKRHILVMNAAQMWLERWRLTITKEDTRLLLLKTCRAGERPEKEFACEECKYTTMTKAYLKDHIRRMHLVRGVGWMCVEGTCENKPKTFVNNRLLLQHKKDHQNLPCPSCIKTFTSKRNLNRHMKLVHKQQQNIDRQSQEDSMSFVPAQQVSVGELLNLSTFDLEGAVVLPLDPLICWLKKPHSLWSDWSSLWRSYNK